MMQSISFKTSVLIAILFCYGAQRCIAQKKQELPQAKLSNSVPPSKNFDLSSWKLTVPADSDGNGIADDIGEAELNQGYQSDEYFFTDSDGGMVFKAPVKGFKTSKNTKYTRTEFREMLRRGDKSIATRDPSGVPNKNNWVFSSAPADTQKLAGAVDGVLTAVLAVNHVTTTGSAKQLGRVIVGQIHAKGDEPIRLYYRKFPNNKRGAIYAAHEPIGRKDKFYDLIGSRHSKDNPSNGFALDEKFGYQIEAEGNMLRVTISDAKGRTKAKQTIDMSDSRYDQPDDFMYFKAGVYNQNSTGRADDYVQATFYKLTATHGKKNP